MATTGTKSDADRVEVRYVASRSELAGRGRLGGYSKAAKYPPAELTAAARQAFAAKFLIEVDAATPSLDDAERQRRAELLRKAYFARLALTSAKARRQRAEAKRRREVADA